MSASNASGARSAGQVRTMFDRVAPRYDVLNDVMSAGLHHRWRSRTADLLDIAPGARVLDVACGTDVAARLARCGLNDLRYIVTGGGIVTIHVGTRA